MNFNSTVAPLAALNRDGAGINVGTGFLVALDGQIWLVPVAHLATGTLRQTDDWTLWSNEISLHDASLNTLARAALFDANDEGMKIPLFKYARSTDTPGLLADIILLPLAANDPMASMSEIFHLPAATSCHIGEEVILVGCRPWPAINTATHVVTGDDGPLLYLKPPAQLGDSGGPVVTSSGELLAMNYGADNPLVPGQALLFKTGMIQALTGTIDGFIEGWKYDDSVTRNYASASGVDGGSRADSN